MSHRLQLRVLGFAARVPARVRQEQLLVVANKVAAKVVTWPQQLYGAAEQVVHGEGALLTGAFFSVSVYLA